VAPERAAWLALLPLLATALYYALPASLQQNLWITFSPQLVAYATLAFWIVSNPGWRAALRLNAEGIILLIIPAWGGDIQFLQETPHAKAPVWLMFPVGIAVIGMLVELNFRGFQMGRLLTLLGQSPAGKLGALLVSALAFSFDPYMVRVFHHLHWIAVWDGLVWGVLLLQTRSLYATMAAHAVEVWILYVSLKLWFG